MGNLSNLPVEDRLQHFIEKLAEKDNTKKYVRGFTNIDSRVTIQCTKCNAIYEIATSVIRSKAKYIYCRNCYEIDKANRIKKQKQDKIRQQAIADLKKNSDKLYKAKQIELCICKECGKAYIGNTLYCSSKCMHKYHDRQKEFNRRIQTNNKADYTISLQKLIKRDNNICYICNKECNLNDYIYEGNTFIAGNYYPSIEHIIPLSKGGTHTWDNVKLAHRICNTLKGTKIIK